ncbi:3-methylcrotonyl-CoA carboxylase [Endozoicomonas montiporae]|uniref:Biotin carboxylase n=3 Tax=Endozoicomonas montiporae TaxID=1027273 RepID=A0A081N466_9GAMM|nr:geranyl-CoA carboxylase alpha subunit [Endozoicomonas montiporae CL-33]KEQ13239.1 3-methylcrotonyl-CoA carboxylase [Endozoicomonas montiporae]
MFNKVLIANRGEIAQRIIRTARDQGYRTVAVYSSADKGSPHVDLADEAVCIGGKTAADSYLNPDKILAAARATDSDAIHPGYGFLSENSLFAAACADQGVTFIGPDPQAIELMGCKRASKVAMQAAGVPCIPGYEGKDQNDNVLMDAAIGIGFPLMVKAAAGGGGRGMRIVTDASQLQSQLESARSEALSAFGSDQLILEKALTRVRHIEIQVFADTHGNVIHLGERDCSMQRRHQKVIEEAPSPVLTPSLRESMGQTAIQAAKACNYVGAGTVEFLLTQDNDYYFLEMNTRLQVEHPVTEWVTGLDLVEWQLRVAAGETLPLTQDDVRIKGHAIEVRLYAEDPAHDFMPQTGTVALWQPALVDQVSSEALQGVRIDSGIQKGSQVSAFYDPMLAKLIAFGDNREQARRRLVRLVQDSHLLGLRDNRAFLSELLNSDCFREGEATTDFIERQFSGNPSLSAQVVEAEEWAVAALLMSVGEQHHRAFHSSSLNSSSLNRSSFNSASVGQRLLKLRCGDEAQQWGFTRLSADCYRLERDGLDYEIQLVELLESQLRYMVKGVLKTVTFYQNEQTLWLTSPRGNLQFDDISLVVDKQSASGSSQVLASMDGVVVDVLVESGQRVKRGDLLVVIEAMKMEHPLKAGVDGVVNTVLASAGDQVKGRQLLIELEDEKAES